MWQRCWWWILLDIVDKIEIKWCLSEYSNITSTIALFYLDNKISFLQFWVVRTEFLKFDQIRAEQPVKHQPVLQLKMVILKHNVINSQGRTGLPCIHSAHTDHRSYKVVIGKKFSVLFEWGVLSRKNRTIIDKKTQIWHPIRR